MYHINEADAEELSAIDLEMKDKKDSRNEEEFWWNRANLTVLDLSSNSLATISPEIKNLLDLQTLNVSIRGFGLIWR